MKDLARKKDVTSNNIARRSSQRKVFWWSGVVPWKLNIEGDDDRVYLYSVEGCAYGVARRRKRK